jgi:hypothetical protein
MGSARDTTAQPVLTSSGASLPYQIRRARQLFKPSCRVRACIEASHTYSLAAALRLTDAAVRHGPADPSVLTKLQIKRMKKRCGD